MFNDRNKEMHMTTNSGKSMKGFLMAEYFPSNIRLKLLPVLRKSRRILLVMST